MAMRTDGYGHGARPTIVGLMTVVMLMVVISNAWPAQETATVPAVAGDTANEGRLFLAASDGESGIASDFFLATPDRTGKWAASSGDWDVRLRIEGNAVNGRFAWNDVTKSYNGNIRGKIDEYGLLEARFQGGTWHAYSLSGVFPTVYLYYGNILQAGLRFKVAE